MTEVIEAMVICGEKAAKCVCALELKHEGPHCCKREGCGGKWKGTPGKDNFEIVELPFFGGSA